MVIGMSRLVFLLPLGSWLYCIEVSFTYFLLLVVCMYYRNKRKGGDATLRRKQVVIIVSIAVVSFLIGTSVATDGGNPFDRIWDAFFGLESRVEALEEQSIPEGFVSTPAYDSGWVDVDSGYNWLIHGLNTTEVFVYVQSRGEWFMGFAISYNVRYGEWLWWVVTDNAIGVVIENPPDEYVYDEIRVRMWLIQEQPT